MDYESLLCIGGPKDGQRITIAKGYPFICIPAPLDPCTSVADSTSEPSGEFEAAVYRREYLRDFDRAIVEVLVADGVKNPFQRLIAGYKPTNDSAGKA